MSKGIALQAILSGIRTTPDGGWVISFDVPQSEVQSVMQLSELRDTALCVAVVHENETHSATDGVLEIEGEPLELT